MIIMLSAVLKKIDIRFVRNSKMYQQRVRCFIFGLMMRAHKCSVLVRTGTTRAIDSKAEKLELTRFGFQKKGVRNQVHSSILAWRFARSG